MKIVLNKDIQIEFDERLQFKRAVEFLSEELKHENPDLKKYRNYSRVPFNIPEYVYSFDSDITNLTINIPRGCGDILRQLLKEINYKLSIKDIEDWTTKGHRIYFKHKFEPRDEMQVQAINSYINEKKKNLILNCSCGFGKSFCALKIVEKLSISTLILVDENLLLDQWIDNIKNDCVFDLTKLGIVGKGKEDYKDKDIIVASKDTLINRPEIIEYINQHIGFVIVDEAHVASADIFQGVLKNLSPTRVLGLTATPKRSDGLSYLMHEQLGPICYRANRADLLANNSIMNPSLRVIYVNNGKYFENQFESHKNNKRAELQSIAPDENGKYKIGNRKFTQKTLEKKIKAIDYIDMDWTFLSNAIENDIKTIKEISKIIKYHYDNGDQSICICRKIEFAKKYLNTLKSLGIPEDEISLILGETKSSERTELIEKAKNQKLKVIITSSILDKGISIDSANVLFLLYPSKNENSTEQRIGRVSRTYQGKERAFVYDFIYNHGMFFSQFYKSQNVEYRECRWNVEKECTNYDVNKITNFTNKMISKFYFGEDILLDEIDINNLQRTLGTGKMLTIQEG